MKWIPYTLPNGQAMPTRDRLIHASFVDCPYEELSRKSKYYSRDHFRIADCSLIEYIGVEWSRGMPGEKHLAYMTQVFDTLASVGNDTAALSAFQVLAQVLSHTELFLRRAKYDPEPTERWRDKMHPFYPSRILEDVLREELRYELLEFVRTRFWMMPAARPETIGSVAHEEGKHDLALLHTRKAMIRATAHDWHATPRDKNDELAFTMLCSMANPWHGACPTPPTKPDWVKELRDVVQQEIRYVFTEHTHFDQYQDADARWKYWLIRDDRPLECEAVLDVLAKTRAAQRGYKGAIADIAAHEKVKAFTHQVT